MLDWKILAASFAALLVVSSVLVGGFGFTDILDTLRDWMGDSPFEGFVTSPLRSSEQASVILYPETFELSLDRTSFSAGDANFTDFSGQMNADLSSGKLEFLQKDTDLTISLSLTEITLDDVSIGKLSLEDTEFHVISNSLDTSGQNATLELSDFSGQITITNERVQMDGNFTSIKGNGKPII